MFYGRSSAPSTVPQYLYGLLHLSFLPFIISQSLLIAYGKWSCCGVSAQLGPQPSLKPSPRRHFGDSKERSLEEKTEFFYEEVSFERRNLHPRCPSRRKTWEYRIWSYSPYRVCLSPCPSVFIRVIHALHPYRNYWNIPRCFSFCFFFLCGHLIIVSVWSTHEAPTVMSWW